MRTDLWTLMRGGSGGGGGGGRAASGRPKERVHRPPPPPPPPDPSGQVSLDLSDAPSSPSPAPDASLHLRPESIAFASAEGPHGRPRGPPPPPPASLDPHQPQAADRRSQPTIALPRRSILAPESKQEDGDEDADVDVDAPKRTRSRILSELRPVASPREAAEMSTPLAAEPQLEPPPSPMRLWLPDEDDAQDAEGDYYASDADGTPSSARRRAFDIFASRRVRLQHHWRADLWIFMKNAHPALALCVAHRWHPFRKLDRVLVLLVALAATLLVSGIVATRPCCSTEAATVPTTSVPSASVPTLPLSVRNATAGSATGTSCACGLAHTSALVAVAIAAVVPLVILLLEPLVTLYHDAKLFGCAVRVRRGRTGGASGPAASASPRPSGCCAYRADGLAARVGRAFVLILLLVLTFAVGTVAARIWDADGPVDPHAALVEWAVLFAAAAALGLVGLCSALWLALFAVRWWREGRAAKADAAHQASVLVHQWPTHEPSPREDVVQVV